MTTATPWRESSENSVRARRGAIYRTTSERGSQEPNATCASPRTALTCGCSRPRTATTPAVTARVGRLHHRASHQQAAGARPGGTQGNDSNCNRSPEEPTRPRDRTLTKRPDPQVRSLTDPYSESPLVSWGLGELGPTSVRTKFSLGSAWRAETPSGWPRTRQSG